MQINIVCCLQKKQCRKDLANDLYNKYGDDSSYRILTRDLGVAMGCNKAKKTAEINKNKSQFYRWKNWDLNNDKKK